MSDAKKPTPPYQLLGDYLKSIRRKVNESLPEVSGAVEIEPESLEQIERGYELPNEDILMLLINHFELRDDEAVKLWQLAGYDQSEIDNPRERPAATQSPSPKQAMLMVLAMSDHVIYTDGINIEPSDTGLVINFTQTTKSNNQNPIPVSKVGMSYDQAEKVLVELARTMLYRKYSSGPRRLSDSSSGETK